MVRSVCECGKIHNNLQIPIVCECGKKRQIQKEPIKETHGSRLNPPLHVKASVQNMILNMISWYKSASPAMEWFSH